MEVLDQVVAALVARLAGLSDIVDKACGLIRHFEGCRLIAYLDDGGTWTIGWGATFYPGGLAVEGGDTVSQERADAMLELLLEGVVGDVRQMAPMTTPNQLAALCDFAYNLGVPALRTSTLLRLLRRGDVAGAAAQFPSWDHEHRDGQLVEVPGLLTRRRAESALFLTA
jgi:lysozyme